MGESVSVRERGCAATSLGSPVTVRDRDVAAVCGTLSFCDTLAFVCIRRAPKRAWARERWCVCGAGEVGVGKWMCNREREFVCVCVCVVSQRIGRMLVVGRLSGLGE